MAKALKIAPGIGARLLKLRGEKTREDFAKSLGVKAVTYGTYETGRTKVPIEFLVQLRDHIDVDLNWLLTGEGDEHLSVDSSEIKENEVSFSSAVREHDKTSEQQRDIQANLKALMQIASSQQEENYGIVDKTIPIYGTAAGSVVGSIAIKQDAIGWTDRPNGLLRVKDAYALYVTGSSMEPRYFPGELIFVNPHRPPKKGDIVVIQVQLIPDGEILSYIKEFSHRNDENIVTKQYNPLSNVEFSVATVKDVHRVLTTNELLNV